MNFFSTKNEFDYPENSKSITLTKSSEESPYTDEQVKDMYRNYSCILHQDVLKDLDLIPHNMKINNVEYKYGIQAKNLPFTQIVIKSAEPLLPNTSTENLFEILNLDKDSSYESLILKYQQEFNSELDMYGNIVKAGETQHEVTLYIK